MHNCDTKLQTWEMDAQYPREQNFTYRLSVALEYKSDKSHPIESACLAEKSTDTSHWTSRSMGRPAVWATDMTVSSAQPRSLLTTLHHILT